VISGARLKRGPEDEPIGLALESLRWYGLFGRFGDAERDWWAGLAEVRVPLLAVAAAGDRQDPPWACRKLLEQFGSAISEFLCLGKENGFASDFGHVEMLVSKEAQREVWPLVARWLDKTREVAGSVERAALERVEGVPPEQ
jgi:poly(3-hydroxyalkanoate) synthetase